MFDSTSRYYKIHNAVYVTSDGRRITYKKRRFLPQASEMPKLGKVTGQDGDRLDLIAYQTLGDALLSWRIADANDAIDPAELTASPGRVLEVPDTSI